MSEQMSIDQMRSTFDSARALQAAVNGQVDALDAQRATMWRELADNWLDDLEAGTEITADDLVWSIGLPGEGAYKSNAVGGWFGQKSRAGRIVWTGEFRKSGRIISHGNLQRVWRVK